MAGVHVADGHLGALDLLAWVVPLLVLLVAAHLRARGVFHDRLANA